MHGAPGLSISGGQNFTNPVSALRGPDMPRPVPTQQLTLLVGQGSKSCGLELYSYVRESLLGKYFVSRGRIYKKPLGKKSLSCALCTTGSQRGPYSKKVAAPGLSCSQWSWIDSRFEEAAASTGTDILYYFAMHNSLHVNTDQAIQKLQEN